MYIWLNINKFINLCSFKIILKGNFENEGFKCHYLDVTCICFDINDRLCKC